MRAAWYEKVGDAKDVLQVGQIDDPTPDSNEVLISVKTSGINPSDVKIRAGARGELQFSRVIPHSDGAGTIIEVGKDVNPQRIGERVWIWNAAYGRPNGTCAELISLPEEQAIAMNDDIGFEAGACLGIPASTAYYGIFANGSVANKTLMITGGAGAVGFYGIQLAKWAGANVISTVSNEEKAKIAKDAGADLILNYKEDDVVNSVLEYTKGDGVDRVLEVEFGGNIPINQNGNEKIMDDDSIIAISMDDDTVIKDGKNILPDESKMAKEIKLQRKKDNIFIFGHNEGDLSRLKVMCDHLSKYLDDGSSICLVNENKNSLDIVDQVSSSSEKEIKISFIEGDYRSREFLESLQIENGTKILILSPYNGLNDIDSCDAKTLFTLINLRDIEKRENKNFVLTTELINSNNAEIFSSDKDDDYLYSEDIVQSMLVQISENPALDKFFDDLASPQGSEIYFKPLINYVDVSEPIDFYTICKSALDKNQTAIGYQIADNEHLKELDCGIVINPIKSEKKLFNKEDMLIVFADD